MYLYLTAAEGKPSRRRETKGAAAAGADPNLKSQRKRQIADDESDASGQRRPRTRTPEAALVPSIAEAALAPSAAEAHAEPALPTAHLS